MSRFFRELPEADASPIRGTTRLLGLIGDPVGHSLSPAMHNAALAAADLDYVYVPLPVKAEDLAAAVGGLRAVGALGFNITIPHKTRILALVDRVEPAARAVGATNTVRIEPDGSLTATNTDVAGFLAPLADRPWQGRTALLLGCGGAARAVVAACRLLGFGRIQVAARDPDKLAAFAADLAVEALPWDDLAAALSATHLLINSTPVGMYPHSDESPVADLAPLPSDALVYDLVYRPRPTRLLRLAAARGLTTLDGLPMLVGQAEAAFHFWMGQTAPAGVMARAAETALLLG